MTGIHLPPEAEALVAGMVGRWPEPRDIAQPAIPGDPLYAIANDCDLAPTGSGPLDGLTLAVKDNVAVGGVAMAVGSGLPGFRPAHDAAVVARARAAGARVVAKAQCEAFLLGANSFSSRPEPVRNPYDPMRSAGGSSSGSAALLAARRVDLAIGSDSGGSIRIPASFCGVVGFKPSRGRVPCTGMAPMEPSLAHAGPMAVTVAGVAALFGVLDGPDGVDPRQAWARTVDAPVAASLAGLRIGVLEAGFALADRAVGAALGDALARLDREGAVRGPFAWGQLEEAQELHLAAYVLGQALTADAPGGPMGFAPTNPQGWAAWRAGVADDDLPPAFRMEIEAGREMLRRDSGLYPRALRRAAALADALDALLADVDVLALPTAAAPPPARPRGEVPPELLYGDTRLTAPFNLTGHPAISVPAGMADGLPVGLQLVARRGADAALLAAAALVERALGPVPPPPTSFGEPL